MVLYLFAVRHSKLSKFCCGNVSCILSHDLHYDWSNSLFNLVRIVSGDSGESSRYQHSQWQRFDLWPQHWAHRLSCRVSPVSSDSAAWDVLPVLVLGTTEEEGDCKHDDRCFKAHPDFFSQHALLFFSVSVQGSWSVCHKVTLCCDFTLNESNCVCVAGVSSCCFTRRRTNRIISSTRPGISTCSLNMWWSSLSSFSKYKMTVNWVLSLALYLHL